jgi:hypothetical protein
MIKISNASETKGLSLTIYNGGFGAVKEIRNLQLTGEETEVVFSDVAQLIETDSLLVEGLDVLEFNYDYDLVDRDKLLRRYIGGEVFLRRKETGDRKSCRLLSVEAGGKCVLEDSQTREIYIDTQDEIILPSLPSGLILKPALLWKIAKSNAREVKVSYLSGGFNWSANYVVEIMGNTLNLSGWAEIENRSGATFEDAGVKLIAGDVNRVEDEECYSLMDSALKMSSAAPQAEEKAFFDYHMYTLLNPTTLKDNQTKQINILNGSGVPYKKYYKLDEYQEKAAVVIEFANRKANGLGLALPQGKIKLYKADDADNSLEFIGEDRIDHTPKDEDIKLSIGNAFDITFEATETERWKEKGFEYSRYEYDIKNHKDEAAEVHFEHKVWGIWEMINSSHEYKKKTSDSIEFCLDIPADSEAKVEFECKIDRRKEITIKKE